MSALPPPSPPPPPPPSEPHAGSGREEPWYAGGLAFECTMCGNCCTGPPGWVSYTDDEAAAMAKELGISLREFLDRYTHTPRGRRSLQERRTEYGYDCIFLDRETLPGRAICRVYRARPQQCRTWPFWPENLRHPRQWTEAGRTCPGIDRGPLIPLRVIVERRDSTPL